MPTYEYQCEKCGPFEIQQRITEPALSTHAVCGEPVRRLISRNSFRLRGSGWYADGYSGKPGAATGSQPKKAG